MIQIIGQYVLVLTHTGPNHWRISQGLISAKNTQIIEMYWPIFQNIGLNRYISQYFQNINRQCLKPLFSHFPFCTRFLLYPDILDAPLVVSQHLFHFQTFKKNYFLRILFGKIIYIQLYQGEKYDIFNVFLDIYQ